MINTFFIGDTHFGHANIIKHEKAHRPFSSIEEHDEELIKRWNSVVCPRDIVYHLGDFCFGKENIKVAARLNGSKRLIMGNHDQYSTGEYLKYFDKLHGALYIRDAVLTHIPVHHAHTMNYANIHGHLHSRPSPIHYDREGPPNMPYINVSCEQINLTPISIEQLKNKYPEWGK